MSSESPAIRVRELSKCYEIYVRPQDRLKQSIHPRLQRLLGREPKTYYREFWALKDVSFEVNKGEAVGIIGRNGAGKSTLLQLICGTLTPSSGSVEVEGKIAALLELGSGFNPEFTGRENVYLSASVLGLKQEEIDCKFDEIAAFADIGDFLDQPIKTYSSGMMMRLAFAVNTCIEPQVLIVDEALSVGDAPFQSKCFRRLRQLIDSGTGLLFVSHDISIVRSICQKAIWLKNGHTQLWGDAKHVAKEYEKFCWQEQGVTMHSSKAIENEVSRPSPMPITAFDGSFSCPQNLFKPNPAFEARRERSRAGTGAVVIKNFLVLDKAGAPALSCDYDDELTLYYLLDVREQTNSDFIIGVRFRDLKGNFVYSTNDLYKFHRLTANQGEQFVVCTKIRVPLTHQDYVILTGIFGFSDGIALVNGSYDFSRSVIWDLVDDTAYITVRPFKLMPLPGPVHVSAELRLEKMPG